LVICGISRQAYAGQYGSMVARENRHTVPGPLPLPDCFVPGSAKSIRGKLSLLRLELLETNHVRLSSGQPGQEVIKPLIDVVDVERRNPHPSPSLNFWGACQKEQPSSLAPVGIILTVEAILIL